MDKKVVIAGTGAALIGIGIGGAIFVRVRNKKNNKKKTIKVTSTEAIQKAIRKMIANAEMQVEDSIVFVLTSGVVYWATKHDVTELNADNLLKAVNWAAKHSNLDLKFE